MKSVKFYIGQGLKDYGKIQTIHVAESESGSVFWREATPTKGMKRQWLPITDGITTNPETGIQVVWFNSTRFRLIEPKNKPSVRLPY